MPANLYDANIFTDFTVWLDDIGKIGQCPSFQPPDIQVAVESFRGGGMDGEVEMPFGIEKIDFEFDMHTWDTDIWTYFGYGPGSLNTPVVFRGSMMSASGAEEPVLIETRALVKSIKTAKVQAGKKVEMTVMLNCNKYTHTVNDKVITNIDLFRKVTVVNGIDLSRQARANLGFSY